MTPTDFEPDFDIPFMVTDEDNVVPYVPNLYAPSVWHDDDSDIYIDSDNWEALTGFTGQYSYNGAVMHPSEVFRGSLRNYVMTNPGIYVLCVVEVMPESADEAIDNAPAGWCVLRAF